MSKKKKNQKVLKLRLWTRSEICTYNTPRKYFVKPRANPWMNSTTQPISSGGEALLGDSALSQPTDAAGFSAKPVGIDRTFLVRLHAVMKLSGTKLLSFPHLYLWQLLFLSILYAQLVVLGTKWVGEYLS